VAAAWCGKLKGPANTWEASVAQAAPGPAEPGVRRALRDRRQENWAPVHLSGAGETTLLVSNVELPVSCREGFLRAVLFARGYGWKQGHSYQLQEQAPLGGGAPAGAGVIATTISARQAAATMARRRVAPIGREIVPASYSGARRGGSGRHPPSRTSDPEMTWLLGTGPRDLAALASSGQLGTVCGCPA